MNSPRYTVGCVPYANGIPLVAWFESMADRSPVRVIYDVPSRLPALLESGEADAVMVSSIDALRHPGRQMADYVCIGSDGPVLSVRLFAKVPPESIRTLALDASSMTSNRLAEIILRDRYGRRPETFMFKPDLLAMLNEADACVLIGDAGMAEPPAGVQTLDLGAEWSALTGLPFVWAAWIGNGRLTAELALLLATAASTTIAGKSPRNTQVDPFVLRRWLQMLPSSAVPDFEQLLDFCASKTGMDRELLRTYYRDTIIYDLTQPMMEGYREFQRRLIASGFEDCRHFPELVQGAGASLPRIHEIFQTTTAPNPQ